MNYPLKPSTTTHPPSPQTVTVPPSFPFSSQFELQLEQLVCDFATRYIPTHVYIASNPSILQSYNMQGQYYLLCPHLSTLSSSNHPHPHFYPFFDHSSIIHYQPKPCKIEQPVKIQDDSPALKECKEEAAEQGRPVSRFKYPKKNVESNVVNQCLSYLATKSKSYSMARRVLKEQSKIQLFYAVLREGRKKQAKYMGRTVLQNLLQLEYEHPAHVAFRKIKGKKIMRIAEVRRTLRVLTHYFLRSLAIPSILTSPKLDKQTIREHVIRARQISEHINLAASIYF